MPVDDVRRYEHAGAVYSERPGSRVILMTATLTPPPSAVARFDPAMRMRDYSAALSFYLSLPSERFDRIILADNSASNLTPLLELTQRENRDKRVEFLSFQANDHSPARGKAYGEFRILDIALETSACLRADDHVWKTTGRLRCLNITALDAAVTRDYCFVCDLYNLPFVRTGRWSDRGRIDLRLFRFQPRAYDHWIRGQGREGPAPFDESYLYRVMIEARKQVAVCPRFPIQPHVAGVSGRTQRDYLSTSQRLKDNIRSVTRRIAPWLWL